MNLFESRSRTIVFLALLLPILGYLDYITGYEFNFFIFYFIPVAIGGWHLGVWGGIGTAILCSTIWGVIEFFSGHPYSHPAFVIWNTMARLAAFTIIGLMQARLAQLLQRERQTSEELKKTLGEVKVLEGLLPICASCKQIRNDKGAWSQIETYIGEHSHAQFTHSICPSCARKLLQEAGLPTNDAS